LSALRPFLERGVPILGLEPSCLFTFRDEYAALLPGDADAQRLAEAAKLADEYLAGELRAGRCEPPWRVRTAREIKVHGHCHQKAFGVVNPILEVLGLIPGAKPALIESSCCGMAGSFGYEAAHYEVSMQMAELSLLPAVRRAPDAILVADGTSCRHQIADGAGRQALHVARLLAQQLAT
jgi:Fe-S oxidoreductase